VSRSLRSTLVILVFALRIVINQLFHSARAVFPTPTREDLLAAWRIIGGRLPRFPLLRRNCTPFPMSGWRTGRSGKKRSCSARTAVFKEQGFAYFNLGMAPMAGFSSHRLAPIWRPRYLAYTGGSVFSNLLDAAILIAGGIRGLFKK
jgi:hypothetical protein